MIMRLVPLGTGTREGLQARAQSSYDLGRANRVRENTPPGLLTIVAAKQHCRFNEYHLMWWVTVGCIMFAPETRKERGYFERGWDWKRDVLDDRLVWRDCLRCRGNPKSTARQRLLLLTTAPLDNAPGGKTSATIRGQQRAQAAAIACAELDQRMLGSDMGTATTASGGSVLIAISQRGGHRNSNPGMLLSVLWRSRSSTLFLLVHFLMVICSVCS